MKKTLFFLAFIIIFLAYLSQKNIIPQLSFLNIPKPSTSSSLTTPPEKQTVVYQESVITKVVADALPSVVTVGISKTTTTGDRIQINPSDPFGPFQTIPGQQKQIEQNIGSGFIITADGLIITNKHVIADDSAKYQVITNDKKKYLVEKIYSDQLNDLAILKIGASGLKPLKLGDSTHLQLGQLAIAIGTPLGEFQNTVTAGIISGLGRGITAGSPFEGFVEKLDDVIQTDAAISPGNSGGPLLNSASQVIGINTAIASEGQNIGFAIPVNVIKELIKSFNERGGQFERPYIGVRYQMVDKKTAILNDIVEGAYIKQVIEDSPASKAGLQEEDIITEFDGQKVSGDDDQSLAKIINEKKIGDRVQIKVWRNGEVKTFSLTLESYSQ
ncbi:hypothetical protein A3F03_00235 [Candidatus Roizmanbacteria bacterium RIFCSPHIGHO2_12_FULL_41_11]|uniref:PDZ domain-containing protein n=2 Tax=Candidatus Roizmaniibacteriota TaxID=1752723 RepID=A0A1F7J9V9_9BACT|nr:MAG: hypothetical protein A3F03_00235 [Candidatus Roizmanbacteria bacterium RIFCSPHIGHO2_12_FULL_41_11]OGK52394.1 MAG: hypothetical protein A2966_01865 [Candidatus Roizmanbacteria bacterium RIFCSPLOWO2_01_FULL_41_22]